jgi:hypothetical protein
MLIAGLAVTGFGKAKARLDTLCGVSSWVLHDLRRTARTHFSAPPVQDLVRELVIAHARPGLHAVYDQHSYRDEKLEWLRVWEARLAGIVAPKPPADVPDLGAARQRRAFKPTPAPQRPRPPASIAAGAAPVEAGRSKPSMARRPPSLL